MLRALLWLIFSLSIIMGIYALLHEPAQAPATTLQLVSATTPQSPSSLLVFV